MMVEGGAKAPLVTVAAEQEGAGHGGGGELVVVGGPVQPGRHFHGGGIVAVQQQQHGQIQGGGEDAVGEAEITGDFRSEAAVLAGCLQEGGWWSQPA